LRKPEISIETGTSTQTPTIPSKDPKVLVAIQMLESEKSSLKNLQMQKLMPPRARGNSRNEAVLPSQKESTAWITIYAFTAANPDIKP
jgi:hypothetical protein